MSAAAPRARERTGRIRVRLAWPAAALAGCSLTAWLSLRAMVPGGDYETEARPSFEALAHGHVLGFLQLVPAYGGSLVERAPFALLPGLWGGGQGAVYRLVALPCLLAGAALGLWLIARVPRARGATFVKAVTLGLCVASPVAFRAFELGHPEELLGAVLCVSAVLCAQRGRAVAAGVLLGLAIANKEWALLAVGPALLALPSRRTLMLLSAAAAAGVVLAPLVLVGGGGFAARAGATASGTGGIFAPMQVFWLLGETGAAPAVMGAVRTISHPLIISISLPLTALLWRSRAGTARAAHEPAVAMLLLALLLLLRCMIDPWDNVYYPLPLLMALLVWETCERRRPPALALLATGTVWVDGWLAQGGYLQPAAILFLAWSLPLAGWMIAMLFRPSRARGRAQETTVSSRLKVVRISPPVSVTSARSSIRTPQLPGT
jgi:hypothetical protein